MAKLSSPLKQRVRSFLTDQGAPPRAQLSRNYDQIFALLQRRRADDSFWGPLTELLRDLVGSVVDSKDPQLSRRPEARLLALWDVKELAQLLRTALPQELPTESTEIDESHGPQWPQLTRGLSPNALGLFLLLSLAACACDSPPPNPTGGIGQIGGASATGGASHSGGASASDGGAGVGGNTSAGSTSLTCDRDAGNAVATDAGHALPPSCCADTASELWNAIQDSTLSSGAKQSLYTCFANLNATWCDGLVNLFKTASATQIADYLNELVTCSCRGSGPTGDFAAIQQKLIEGMQCSVILYKGVTFPS